MPTLGVFDLMTFLPPGSPPLDGALGLDLFADRAVTIDPAHGELIVESPGSLAARVRAGREIDVRRVRDAQGLALTLDAGVVTPRGIAWMELDTGNTGTFVVASHIAPLLGLDPKIREGQQADIAHERDRGERYRPRARLHHGWEHRPGLPEPLADHARPRTWARVAGTCDGKPVIVECIQTLRGRKCRGQRHGRPLHSCGNRRTKMSPASSDRVLSLPTASCLELT